MNSAHSVEKLEILSHQKNTSSNQLFNSFFSKNVLSQNFCLSKFPSRYAKCKSTESSLFTTLFLPLSFSEANTKSEYEIHAYFFHYLNNSYLRLSKSPAFFSLTFWLGIFPELRSPASFLSRGFGSAIVTPQCLIFWEKHEKTQCCQHFYFDNLTVDDMFMFF